MKIENFKEILEEEGFRPKIDDDGDIVFKFESKTYLLEISEEDEHFVRIILPNFWELESDEETVIATSKALEITRNVKVAKVFPIKNTMWSSAELFLPDEDSIRPLLEKILAVVSGAAVLFAREMRESNPEA